MTTAHTVLLVLDLALRQSAVLHTTGINACLELKKGIISQLEVGKRKDMIVQCVVSESVADELIGMGM